MSDGASKGPIPGRAMASIVLACASLYTFRIYGQVHWLPNRFSKETDEIFRRLLSQVGPIRDELDIGYRVLAVLALLWCIWSWRTEQSSAAVVATVFTVVAMFCAVFIVI